MASNTIHRSQKNLPVTWTDSKPYGHFALVLLLKLLDIGTHNPNLDITDGVMVSTPRVLVSRESCSISKVMSTYGFKISSGCEAICDISLEVRQKSGSAVPSVFHSAEKADNKWTAFIHTPSRFISHPEVDGVWGSRPQLPKMFEHVSKRFTMQNFLVFVFILVWWLSVRNTAVKKKLSRRTKIQNPSYS